MKFFSLNLKDDLKCQVAKTHDFTNGEVHPNGGFGGMECPSGKGESGAGASFLKMLKNVTYLKFNFTQFWLQESLKFWRENIRFIAENQIWTWKIEVNDETFANQLERFDVIRRVYGIQTVDKRKFSVYMGIICHILATKVVAGIPSQQYNLSRRMFFSFQNHMHTFLLTLPLLVS